MNPAELGGNLRFADVRLVIGTRPEAIKLAPVARALNGFGLRPSLILTGQHPDLDPSDHGFGDCKTVRLHCPGKADPDNHVELVAQTMLKSLRPRPDLIVVQGDTSSALGGALAGFRAGVPVAHVEAGLRSHDAAMPWPEEGYRTAIDARAALLFAPTDLAASNLRQEQVPGEIFVTGNTGIDAVLRANLPAPVRRKGGVPRLLVTCHRRESWSDGLQSVALALHKIAQTGRATIEVLLHPNRHVSHALEQLVGGRRGITVLAPCSHQELLARMRDCDLMLSDSGGVQEEAPAMGVPLLVLRERTERPEAIWSGNMRLVGTNTRAIVDAVTELLGDPLKLAAMAKPAFPYGDGSAGLRIATIIDGWLSGTRAGKTISRC